MALNYNLHDTHAHLLEMLQKLELIQDNFDYNLQKPVNLDSFVSLKEKTQFLLDEMLNQHEFVWHSTVDYHNFWLVYNLFKENNKVKLLFGSHPEIVSNDFNLNLYLQNQQFVWKFVQNNNLEKIVGIGEVGLDYYYTQENSIINKQKELFVSQIDLAIENNLPLIIHCRQAFEDIFDILKKSPKILGKFLIHCFTGNASNLKQALELGGIVAFGGISTFKSATDLQEAIKICPLENFVLETDLPFLAPNPYRGKVCLPKYIDIIAQEIAKLKDLHVEEIWLHSKKNSQKLLQIKF